MGFANGSLEEPVASVPNLCPYLTVNYPLHPFTDGSQLLYKNSDSDCSTTTLGRAISQIPCENSDSQAQQTEPMKEISQEIYPTTAPPEVATNPQWREKTRADTSRHQPGTAKRPSPHRRQGGGRRRTSGNPSHLGNRL